MTLTLPQGGTFTSLATAGIAANSPGGNVTCATFADGTQATPGTTVSGGVFVSVWDIESTDATALTLAAGSHTITYACTTANSWFTVTSSQLVVTQAGGLN